MSFKSVASILYARIFRLIDNSGNTIAQLDGTSPGNPALRFNHLDPTRYVGANNSLLQWSIGALLAKQYVQLRGPTTLAGSNSIVQASATSANDVTAQMNASNSALSSYGQMYLIYKESTNAIVAGINTVGGTNAQINFSAPGVGTIASTSGQTTNITAGTSIGLNASTSIFLQATQDVNVFASNNVNLIPTFDLNLNPGRATNLNGRKVYVRVGPPIVQALGVNQAFNLAASNLNGMVINVGANVGDFIEVTTHISVFRQAISISVDEATALTTCTNATTYGVTGTPNVRLGVVNDIVDMSLTQVFLVGTAGTCVINTQVASTNVNADYAALAANRTYTTVNVYATK